jgi:hypothetical protein
MIPMAGKGRACWSAAMSTLLILSCAGRESAPERPRPTPREVRTAPVRPCWEERRTATDGLELARKCIEKHGYLDLDAPDETRLSPDVLGPLESWRRARDAEGSAESRQLISEAAALCIAEHECLDEGLDGRLARLDFEQGHALARYLTDPEEKAAAEAEPFVTHPIWLVSNMVEDAGDRGRGLILTIDAKTGAVLHRGELGKVTIWCPGE